MNFDVTPELIVGWNLRPAMLPDDAVFLPVKIRAATNHFIVDIGTESFLGSRRTFGKSRRAIEKGIEWTVTSLNGDEIVARGMYPQQIIEDMVKQREALIVSPTGTKQ